MLGFAMRAGKLVIGTELACKAMALTGEKKPKLICVCSDVSEGTKKKLFTKADFYQIPVISLPMEMEALGRLIGKASPPACVAVTDSGFAKEIRLANSEE